MATQSLVIKAQGLNTFPNYFNISPSNLLEALNIVIDRDNIIEPRRGFFEYGNTFGGVDDRVKQLTTYKNRVLRHVENDIQYDNGEGTFIDFSGEVTEVETGLRIKSNEQNGNLYFTTSEGIKKLSAANALSFATTAVQSAGGVKALNLNGTVDYSTPGFLSTLNKVAYRQVWGITDANDNLILGSPSNRLVLENVSGSSAVVELNFPVPSDVTSTSYFYQIYRTAIFDNSASDVDPGDEMYLVYEDFVTSGEITAGTIGPIVDITPEDIRAGGALLYTNPKSGEGIEQANEKPPFATDLATYKGYTFYSNTSTVQRLNFSVLSVDDFISGTSTLTITDGTDTTTYTFRGTKGNAVITFSGAAADFENAGPGTAKYFTLNSSLNDREYLFWFKKSAVNDLEPSVTGKINIELDTTATATVADIAAVAAQALIDTGDFNVNTVGLALNIAWANNGPIAASGGYVDTVGASLTLTSFSNGTGEDASTNRVFLPRVPAVGEVGPTPSQQIEQFSTSLVNVINSQDALVSAYYLSGFNDVPGQILLENRIVTGDAFWIYANSTLTGGEFNPSLPATNVNTVISQNEVKPNRMYYSKFQQPEAVPLVNYLDVGPRDRAITRIVALTDSLFVFKEDEIYRLSGDTAPFQVTSFDKSVYLTAPDSAAVLNNQIYALTTQGVVQVSEGGVQVISRPIENRVLGVQKFGDAYKTVSFGVSYESDRAYHLWTMTNADDEVGTQCFRYNTFTSTWTRWDLEATCGLVNFADNKMYLGAGDDNVVFKERKTLTRLDHADRQFDLNIIIDGVNEMDLSLSSIGNATEGDVLIQTQYLTINQYNRLLKMIDRDNFINQFSTPDYYTTLGMVPGDNVRTKIENLATKLDADPQVDQTDYSADIASFGHTILSSTVTATSITFTFASNDIAVDRVVSLTGLDTGLTGDFVVTASTATTITIETPLPEVATSGTITTNIEDFRDVQTCFNIITTKMNNDNGLFFSSYFSSTGSADQEGTIEEVDPANSILTVNFNLPFIQGVIVLYKAIETEVQYVPQFFGDPSMTKQISEGTLMFENSNYSSATLSYSSDLSPSFIDVTFNGQGIGDFGQFPWSQQNWGGVGAPIPLRTLIPGQKQRCRFLNVKFSHQAAFEKYSIYGLSLTYRQVSTRGYR